jgi:hypothetical protein
MTFESADTYRDFWRAHPAFGGDRWNDDVQAYVDYDAVGDPPEIRSSVSAEAVTDDATEQLTVPEVRDAIAEIPCPAVFLSAPRGLLDGDPLYAPEVLEALRGGWPMVTELAEIRDCNHFTIVIGDGASAVAEHVRKALAEG